MKRTAATLTALVLAVALAACTAESAPDPSVSPTMSTTPLAEMGTRGNPAPIGEMVRLSAESAWTVGAAAPAKVGDDYVVLPLVVEIDWDAIRAQLEAAGEDPASADELGIDPWASLVVRYVAASGRSYDILEDPDVVVTDELWAIGTVYPPATEITANVPVSVPADDIAGGVWTVLNTGGDAVFLSAAQ